MGSLRTMLTANQGAVSTAMMANLDTFFFTTWAWLVSVQREIYGDIATVLRAFAATGDWSLLVAFVPWGVAFGAAHALTPGHSKMVLAMFVAGSGAGFASGLRTAGILASTHILMSVLIVLLGLPLASMALGEVGRAVFLETLSRSLLGLVGLWLLISALRSGNGEGHGHGRGVAFGVTAGLIPCPLTLLVMTFAVAHGVPEAGVAFAAMMLIGVGLALAAVAGGAVLTRTGLGTIMGRLLPGLTLISRVALGLTGIALVVVAVLALLEKF